MIPAAVSALGRDFGASSTVGTVGETVISERSDIAAVLISACVEECRPDISACLGLDLPDASGPVSQAAGMTAIWLSPRSWIVWCSVVDEAAIQEKILRSFPDGIVHASAFTDHLCWLELAGSDAAALLLRGGFVSLDRVGLAEGHAKRTIVADVNVVVVRIGGRLLVGFERSRARFFSAWLLKAADER